MSIPRTFAALSLLCAAVALPATAATSETIQTVSVDISGYDISTPEGAKIVLKKIEKAAERVCNVRTTPDSIRFKQLAAACSDEAIEQAVASLDAPVLKALYRKSS